MKKTLALMMFVLGLGATLFAQTQTQEEYVLEQARAKLRPAPAAVPETPATPPAQVVDKKPKAEAVPADPEAFWDEHDQKDEAPVSRESRIIKPVDEVTESKNTESTPRRIMGKVPFGLEFVPGVPVNYRNSEVMFGLGLVGSGIGRVNGIQSAGIFSLSGDVSGIQASGVFSIASGEFEGIQTSGVFNIARGRIEGIQTSAVFNLADEMSGIQASAVVNVARNIDGIQAGLINIAGTNTGLSVALLSINKNGVRQIQGLWSDADTFRLGMKTGSSSSFTHLYTETKKEHLMQSSESLVVGANFGLRLSTAGDDANKGGLYLDLEAGSKVFVGNGGFDMGNTSYDHTNTEACKEYARIFYENNADRFAFDGMVTLGFTVSRSFGLFVGLNTTVVPGAPGSAMPAAFAGGKSFEDKIGGDDGIHVLGNTRWFFGLSL